jgi:hypothetical protein
MGKKKPRMGEKRRCRRRKSGMNSKENVDLRREEKIKPECVLQRGNKTSRPGHLDPPLARRRIARAAC